MTLFEECKEALNEDFVLIKKELNDDVIAILKQFPFSNGNLIWSDIDHKDYADINELLEANIIKDLKVFVIADNVDIPIFQTNLKLLAENIYDVTALSSKLFIFNNTVIIQPLFPTEVVRLGIMS